LELIFKQNKNMPQNYLHQTKQRFAWVLILLLFFMLAGVISNSEKARAADNSIDVGQLLKTDLDDFDFNSKIADIREDAENYFVSYTYETWLIQDGAWQSGLKQDTLTVSKAGLNGQDLGLYLAKEIGEVIDGELKYLKEVQTIEKENAKQKEIASTEYRGLKGLILNIRDKIFPGYQPVIAEKASQPEENSGSAETENSVPIAISLQDSVNSLALNGELITAQIEANSAEISLIKSVLLGLDLSSIASNANILGKLNTEETANGQLLIKVNEEANHTIGKYIICPPLIEVDSEGKCAIAQVDVAPVDGLDDITLNPLRDGKSEVVKTKVIKANSKVFITPKSAIGQPLAVTNIIEGESFTVEVENPVTENLEFDWWIMEEIAE
jgi:hypothetical protein